MFWLTSIVAIVATLLAISRLNATHALLYLIVSFLSVAVLFLQLGAPFVAAIEVIVYAGAIMVLFVFVIMLLNLGPHAVEGERQLLPPHAWIGPGLLAAVLLLELLMPLSNNQFIPTTGTAKHADHSTIPTIPTEAAPQLQERMVVGPKEVGIKLFSTYLLAVELAGFLLLAGLVGAFHIGREEPRTSAKPGAMEVPSQEGPA
ncbi:MAG: NADH-quinone oxidoreductase subunit J [Planctomycetes bacterium]|nr:NADH-quinone oxidoreductase subunit J [Planctomycetota bacterium]